MRRKFVQIAVAKDPDTAFFKKLDGFQPCEITELKAGTHFFAVYGWFWFFYFIPVDLASYTIFLLMCKYKCVFR